MATMPLFIARPGERPRGSAIHAAGMPGGSGARGLSFKRPQVGPAVALRDGPALKRPGIAKKNRFWDCNDISGIYNPD